MPWRPYDAACPAISKFLFHSILGMHTSWRKSYLFNYCTRVGRPRIRLSLGPILFEQASSPHPIGTCRQRQRSGTPGHCTWSFNMINQSLCREHAWSRETFMILLLSTLLYWPYLKQERLYVLALKESRGNSIMMERLMNLGTHVFNPTGSHSPSHYC